MKTKCFFSHRSALAALLICLLSAPSLTTLAQTYKGQLMLTDAPTQLEANVFPVSNRFATIKVIFNNPTGGEVRLIIRDGKGNVHYDDYSSIAMYRRNFDLSQLPVGAYTVELTKQEKHFARTFAINPPATNWITMDTPSSPDIPSLSIQKSKRLTSNE